MALVCKHHISQMIHYYFLFLFCYQKILCYTKQNRFRDSIIFITQTFILIVFNVKIGNRQSDL